MVVQENKPVLASAIVVIKDLLHGLVAEEDLPPDFDRHSSD